jgi:hypothetical protein
MVQRKIEMRTTCCAKASRGNLSTKNEPQSPSPWSATQNAAEVKATSPIKDSSLVDESEANCFANAATDVCGADLDKLQKENHAKQSPHFRRRVAEEVTN